MNRGGNKGNEPPPPNRLWTHTLQTCGHSALLSPLFIAGVRLPSDQWKVQAVLVHRQTWLDMQSPQSRLLLVWQLSEWGAWPSRTMMLTIRSKSWIQESYTPVRQPLPFMITDYILSQGECLMQAGKSVENTRLPSVLSPPDMLHVPFKPAVLPAPCLACSSSPARHTCSISITHPPLPLPLPACCSPSPLWPFWNLSLRPTFI